MILKTQTSSSSQKLFSSAVVNTVSGIWQDRWLWLLFAPREGSGGPQGPVSVNIPGPHSSPSSCCPALLCLAVLSVKPEAKDGHVYPSLYNVLLLHHHKQSQGKWNFNVLEAEYCALLLLRMFFWSLCKLRWLGICFSLLFRCIWELPALLSWVWPVNCVSIRGKSSCCPFGMSEIHLIFFFLFGSLTRKQCPFCLLSEH